VNEKKDEETKEKIKRKINIREVDNKGNEYETEMNEDEIESIIARGLLLLQEGSMDVVGSDDNGKENEQFKEEDKRNLMITDPDTRYEILTNTWTPVKQAGLLEIGTMGSCSAALIGPRTILTAGHCVHEGAGGDWYSGFRFYPGRISSDISSASSSYYTWSNAMSFVGWTVDGNYDWDIALIQLSSSPNIGYISMGYDTSINDDWYVYSKGYPGDKNYGSMWSTSDYIYKAYTNQLWTDDSDTYYGHSGAPWYAYPSYLTYPRIFAAHSGFGTYNGTPYNRHTRITSTKFTAFCTWINDPSLC
jgi:V8-like Glu-specific endopeptidase